MYASSPASRSIPRWYSTDRSDSPVRRTRYSISGRHGNSCASSWAPRTVVGPKLRGPCGRYSPDPATQWTACIQGPIWTSCRITAWDICRPQRPRSC